MSVSVLPIVFVGSLKQSTVCIQVTYHGQPAAVGIAQWLHFKQGHYRHLEKCPFLSLAPFTLQPILARFHAVGALKNLVKHWIVIDNYACAVCSPQEPTQQQVF